MGKLSKEEVEQIIERDLPDYQVVPESLDREEGGLSDMAKLRDSSRQRSISDATSPDLDTLREKLRRRSNSVDSDRSDAKASTASYDSTTDSTDDEAADDMIVAVKPKKSHSPFDSGYRTKAVVISGRSKRVIGRQG